MASIFNVVRTNQIASKKRVLVADRSDLNMAAQRAAARLSSRGNLQMALMADYDATISSRDTHHSFLTMMVNEVQQYHQRVYKVTLPTRAMEILAEVVATEMVKEDTDHYADCLSIMCHQRLYTAEFQRVAIQLVAQEEEEHRRNTSSNHDGVSCSSKDTDSEMNGSLSSNGSESSSGLSDDGRNSSSY